MHELARLAGDERLFCTFRVGACLYGIEVLHVREISTQVACTPIPQAPPAVRGLVNLRSQIILALDAGALLGLHPVALSAHSRLVILKPHFGEGLGVLVEQGGDIVRVDPEEIEIAGATGGAQPVGVHRAAPVGGVCKLASELLNILEPQRLIAQVEAALNRLGQPAAGQDPSNPSGAGIE